MDVDSKRADTVVFDVQVDGKSWRQENNFRNVTLERFSDPKWGTTLNALLQEDRKLDTCKQIQLALFKLGTVGSRPLANDSSFLNLLIYLKGVPTASWKASAGTINLVTIDTSADGSIMATFDAVLVRDSGHLEPDTIRVSNAILEAKRIH